MHQRSLGNSGISIAPLAFGGAVLGWTADEAASFRLLDAFIDAGANLIDTADTYSNWVPGHVGGESETLIGKWLKQSRVPRDRVVIATKVGAELAPGRKGLSKGHILRSVEGSLRRLQTDVIDLYQSHIDDPVTPQDETLSAYAQLVRDGKVRAIGASNYSAERLREAVSVSARHGYPSYQSLQPEYSLYERAEYETELEPVIREHGLGVLAYWPLASGFLTGKYRSAADLGQSPRGERVKLYLNDRGFRILDALDRVARESDATPAQVAIAWVAARPSVTAPIVGANTLPQLEELMGALRLTLDRACLDLLNQASA